MRIDQRRGQTSRRVPILRETVIEQKMTLGIRRAIAKARRCSKMSPRGRIASCRRRTHRDVRMRKEPRFDLQQVLLVSQQQFGVPDLPKRRERGHDERRLFWLEARTV